MAADKMQQERALQVIAEHADDAETREALKEALDQKATELWNDRQWFAAIRLRRVIRSDRLFEAVYCHSLALAATHYAHSAEFGDGEFLKWLLEWFADGGWEIIIEFIKALLPLFGLI